MDKVYDHVQVLRGASFEVPDGAVTCLVGPNGAGKTTALKALGGLVRPDGGEVQVDGAAPGTSSFPLGHLGLVLGPDHWVESRTGFHSLKGLAMTSGVPESRVRQCLEEAGIAAVRDRKVRTYSLGMRQRLSLAAAMLGQARNLVLDEPFNGLDPEGVRWLRALLRSQAEEGRAVLVSSHLLAEVEDIADRVVVLTEGRVLAQAWTDDVRRSSGVLVRSGERARVLVLARARQWQVEEHEDQDTVLIDAEIEEVQKAFSQEGLSFTEMRQASRTLEDWFFHVLEEGGQES
ncbi:ATP-binding cassette domain-containing protein [Actinomyces lilanjuaniae]|uniref:ATP-binding cassette domain-containing protein n=1 Tax=Actinomyces lilanjuaniae TaxID=2321394 RepID=A0ABM6Z2S4_9ACTO|nr:ATP-binding cassette domain-containing protein [Actinomyces lilanjuaniae]AYD89576.1 ATP-binding cassette domain-containing protein [Actinomyces lilanjuaniae]